MVDLSTETICTILCYIANPVEKKFYLSLFILPYAHLLYIQLT